MRVFANRHRHYGAMIANSLLFGTVMVLAPLATGCSDDDRGGGEQCGNGVVEGNELCDGADLNGQTCSDVGNYSGGDLSCNTDCTFDTSLCTAPVNCGNGTIDGTEECDGTNLNGQTCSDVGDFTGGVLSCRGDCTFDTSQCESVSLCGNGQIDVSEECDGADLNGQNCIDLGFTGGMLSCSDGCLFDTSGCTGSTQQCPREDLGSHTSILYEGDTTGLPNLVTSSRLEWQDAPDDSLLFTAPEDGDYEIVVTDEPSTNGGCGASV